MKILAIGDVTDKRGIDLLRDKLWSFRRDNKIDFVIVNGENAGFVTGPSPEQVNDILSAGADVVSGGNHTMYNYSFVRALDDLKYALRPVNLADAPGYGYIIADAAGYRVLVINALGRVMMNNTVDCPFRAINRVLECEAGRFDVAVVDFHAEASGEKLALAHYLDGRVQAIFGTHTHIPTADEQILPGGTGYITDIGMCGASGGVLGMKSDVIIARYLSGVPHRFEIAEGEARANGVIFDIDVSSRRTVSVERIIF